MEVTTDVYLRLSQLVPSEKDKLIPRKKEESIGSYRWNHIDKFSLPFETACKDFAYAIYLVTAYADFGECDYAEYFHECSRKIVSQEEAHSQYHILMMMTFGHVFQCPVSRSYRMGYTWGFLF